MRTSDTCPNPDRRTAGFTLLEILLVLVLMTMIGGLVVPRVGTLYQSLLLREQRDNLLLQIEKLPYLAAQHGRVYRLADPEADGAEPLEGLEGWALESVSPIVVHASGICSGGLLELQHEDGLYWRYALEAPYCRPREISDEQE